MTGRPESASPRGGAAAPISGAAEIDVRECVTVDDFDACVRLQREAFGLPDLELSPRRHLIVSRGAGGWTLGAFAGAEMVGFVHHLTAVREREGRGREIIGYSHMMAVAAAYQNKGVGARLKWAQRERALAEGTHFIKWTWDPMQARNAHFNLNRLGAVVRSYAVNFYGTDYNTTAVDAETANGLGIDSDRLFASWELRSPRVEALAVRGGQQLGGALAATPPPCAIVKIPSAWSVLLRSDSVRARREQLRVRNEFAQAFADGLVCAGFERDGDEPRYLFFRES